MPAMPGPSQSEGDRLTYDLPIRYRSALANTARVAISPGYPNPCNLSYTEEDTGGLITPTTGRLPPSPMISDVGRDRQFARAPVHNIRLEVPGRACGRERPRPALRGLWSAHARGLVLPDRFYSQRVASQKTRHSLHSRGAEKTCQSSLRLLMWR